MRIRLRSHLRFVFHPLPRSRLPISPLRCRSTFSFDSYTSPANSKTRNKTLRPVLDSRSHSPALTRSMATDSLPLPPRSKDFGKLEFGCDHYKRRCKIRAPCCDKVYSCRHCHNEAASSSSNPKEHHELIRQDVKQVVCAVCDTEQEVAQVCSNCGVIMGEYFCDICKFYDDDITKEQFHCNDCGICRVGGRDKFFHCQRCGSCYVSTIRDNHTCVEDSMKNCCPICYEYLFDSIKEVRIFNCGHTIHKECSKEMANNDQYRCPICSKAVFDMNSIWQVMDMEIAATAMPEECRFDVSILCNDCNTTSRVQFHILGLKCQQCNSYNTRRILTSDDQRNDTQTG